MEDISRFVCCALDHIGYDREIIEIRRNCWRELSRMVNETISHNTGIHLTIAGSKAEGITSYRESDIDFMFLLNDVICTDSVQPFLQLPGMTILQTDMRNTSPGYTKLKMVSFNRKISHSDIEESLFAENSGEIFASSALFSSYIYLLCRTLNDYRIVNDASISGPATTTSHANANDSDFVGALHCICPNVLHSFRTRLRKFDWPPLDIIQDDYSAFCQLVPVGYKGSCDQWKEWRFCFIQTELRLTCSLNNTQIKLYIVLKMISKTILKCVSDEISSYIMKNITFWMSELFGSHIFREENFIALMLVALRLLKVSIDNKCLPYYMIPGRNLLAERLEPNTKHRLSVLISQLLDEGPRLLLRCPKLRAGMTLLYRSPDGLDNRRNQMKTEIFIFQRSISFVREILNCVTVGLI
ncbi:uncharacterized protein LOC128559165 [Mercenaria mercenaria]|uniref:uncharacterized protein LOC128559165 n=1 Tax=Mercenaria mercenaria TaxID=6596 RepID=UPI00234EE5DC|nr:uncharacterized protein LOC128559165 [Mercenaria mercenaria]XP_053406349.1 uncharacterized protein LOC128559165 [Mercenaria mercenaria]